MIVCMSTYRLEVMIFIASVSVFFIFGQRGSDNVGMTHVSPTEPSPYYNVWSNSVKVTTQKQQRGILVSRAHDPSGLRQGSWVLGTTMATWNIGVMGLGQGWLQGVLKTIDTAEAVYSGHPAWGRIN